MEKLKPCPFCGGEAKIMKMGYPHYIYCLKCGAKVHGGTTSEKDSIKAWNRRTEQKHGKWIRHVLKNANVPWGYDCSACGAWFVVGEDTIEKYDYCPNCGAKMERSKE